MIEERRPCFGTTRRSPWLRPSRPTPRRSPPFFQRCKADGSGGSAIEAVSKALDLLAERKDSRKIIIVIGESKDRGSKTPLEQVITRAQRDNVSIYFITYSRFLTPFTARWTEVCDSHGNNCQPRAPEWGDTNLLTVFSEMRALAKTNIAEAFTKYTGGRRVSFLKQPRQRNLWVTDTSNGAGKVRSRRPANPLPVGRRLFLVASWLSNQLERAGKRCAVREDLVVRLSDIM